MSTPELPPPDPSKPSRWSVALVLFAALLIIPGLCFGFKIWPNRQNLAISLVVLWVVLLVIWVLVLLVKGLMYATRQLRRRDSR